VAKPPWLSSSAPKCKNPPRMAAGGFWAEQLTLTKTPHWTGPVNRKLRFLSTSCPQELAADVSDRQERDRDDRSNKKQQQAQLLGAIVAAVAGSIAVCNTLYNKIINDLQRRKLPRIKVGRKEVALTR
jgi:hypothetical protein